MNVTNLHYSYTKQRSILQGIVVTFRGVPTAIIGQHGTGKTTFVKLLEALFEPDSGTIRHIAQNPNDQIFKNNVLDEVTFGPLNVGQKAEVARTNVEKMLEVF